MKWTPEAEVAIRKVPGFVKKKVRARIEKEAAAAGKTVVSPTEVKATQKQFLSGKGPEIKGYEIEVCFGPNGCPNRANPADELTGKIEALLEKEDLLSFLKAQVPEGLKFHHNFRVAISECPNACSQPQIKDIGILGASTPLLTDQECSRCEACVDACRDNAVTLDENTDKPHFDYDRCPSIDYHRCLSCGKCIQACPTGTIGEGPLGYRIQLGGKLGRHPQLARELDGIFSVDQVLAIVKDCIQFYKENSRNGQRFAEIFSDAYPGSTFRDLAFKAKPGE